jgi:hypothetical protein
MKIKIIKVYITETINTIKNENLYIKEALLSLFKIIINIIFIIFCILVFFLLLCIFMTIIFLILSIIISSMNFTFPLNLQCNINIDIFNLICIFAKENLGIKMFPNLLFSFIIAYELSNLKDCEDNGYHNDGQRIKYYYPEIIEKMEKKIKYLVFFSFISDIITMLFWKSNYIYNLIFTIIILIMFIKLYIFCAFTYETIKQIGKKSRETILKIEEP